MHHKIFIVFFGILFSALTVLFNFFPRSSFSELEKRALATFPEFSMEKIKDGSYNKDVGTWYSDSEPYRDHFMAVSMGIKDKMRLKPAGVAEEEVISFHADNRSTSAEDAKGEKPVKMDATVGEIEQYHNELTADDKARIANKGIIVVGSAPNARALMAYGGTANSGAAYARAANKYKETFGDDVNVYCMVIPTSTEYYLPPKAAKASKPFLPTIKNVHSLLDKGVKPVDVYTELGKHVSEPIFLRTDHHWGARGAYYACKAFANVAGVPFKDIKEYDRHVVRGYVGTMYGFSKDINVKKSPEDFEYFTPKGVDYTTTYINYDVDKNGKITRESAPVKGKFFYSFKDGSPSAYLTYMGGDMKLVKVETSTPSNRKVLIIKDSFGNAMPGWLFHSFNEVHVVDMRYFNKNMKKYVADNGITDILFAFNIFNVCSESRANATVKFLNQ